MTGVGWLELVRDPQSVFTEDSSDCGLFDRENEIDESGYIMWFGQKGVCTEHKENANGHQVCLHCWMLHWMRFSKRLLKRDYSGVGKQSQLYSASL